MHGIIRATSRCRGWVPVLLAGVAGCATQGVHSVAPGATWTVDRTTRLTSLTVAPGAAVVAAPGHSLTMTVNRVETDIRPGRFSGNIVLTPTIAMPTPFNEMGSRQINDFRTAIYIDDGAYVPDKSVSAAVQAGPGAVTGTAAKNVTIVSRGNEFNGIMVAGDSHYTIDHPTITLVGNGRNDFVGFGAGIRVGGTANVTINDATIRDRGVVRTAIWVGDHATATINNAVIESRDGVMPRDYDWSWVHPERSKDVMMEVPWMLGIRGNDRATLVVGSGTVTYNNSLIRSEDWGAMSTDDPTGEIRLTAANCRVETVRSGYGAYSVGDSLDTFRHTSFDVADYGIILAGGSAIFTDGSVVNSRRIGVMAHDAASGSLVIDQGSVFNTKGPVIQLKSASPTITVNDAALHSASGVILQSMVDDDPNRGGGPPPGAAASAVPAPDTYDAPHPNKDVNASFKDVTLDGDFINSATSEGAMNLRFENAAITGAITTATEVHATGPHGEKLVMQDNPDLYYLIGREIDTYAPTHDAHGVSVSLSHSHWTVDKASYLTGLDIGRDSTVAAPKGYRLIMTLNGVARQPRPGHFAGALTLRPVKL